MKIPIRHIRDVAVIPDADLAAIYGVPTKRINEQVKRNKDRFPKRELGFHVRERTATYRVKRRRP